MSTDKRELVQNKSKEIGHCVCSSAVKCPCPYFTDKEVCKCSGEKVNDKIWLDYNLKKQS